MNYLRRNLIPIVVGIAAVAGIAVTTAAIAEHLDGDDGPHARFDVAGGLRHLDRDDPGQRARGTVLGVQLDESLKVTAVLPNSAAQRAGIAIGDVLTEVNGRAVKTRADVQPALDAVAPDTDYIVRVSRGGKTIDLTAHRAADRGRGFFGFRGWPFGPTPGTPSPTPTPGFPFPRRDRIDGPRLGVAVEAATGGLRITTVEPGSAAAGVRVGDVVTAANGKPTATVEALRAVVTEAGFGGTVTLNVTRDGAATTLTARIGERPTPPPARPRA